MVLHFRSVWSESLSPLGLSQLLSNTSHLAPQEDRISDRKGGQLIQSCSLILAPASQINSLFLRRKAIGLVLKPSGPSIPQVIHHNWTFHLTNACLSLFRLLCHFFTSCQFSEALVLLLWPEWHHLILQVSGSHLPGDLPWFSLPDSVGYSYYIFPLMFIFRFTITVKELLQLSAINFKL